MDNGTYKDKIIELLEKSKRLGKSRSAEYGRVGITYVGEDSKNSVPQTIKPIKIDNKHYIFLYAKSRLALTNKGINSYRFDLESLKLGKSEKIAWDKSHIRTSQYTPYVAIRDNRDPERLVIDKGSVIAIEVKEDFDVKSYINKTDSGLGLYLSEGHGKVVVNPTFLTDKQPSFVKFKNENSQTEKTTFKEGDIANWLKEQKKKESKNYELLKSVKEFIQQHPKEIKNKKSQWGQIRSLCSAVIIKKSNNKNSEITQKETLSIGERIYDALFSEEIVNNHKKGFLLHGQAQNKWSSSLINALKEKYKEDIDYHAFIILLSIFAPKEDDKGENHE
jgi:hypothetical protein